MGTERLHILNEGVAIRSVHNSKELIAVLSETGPMNYAVIFMKKGDVVLGINGTSVLITPKRLALISSGEPVKVLGECDGLRCYIISIAASFYNGELFRKTTYSKMTSLSGGSRIFDLEPLDNRVITLLFKGLETALKSSQGPSVFVSYIINLLTRSVQQNYAIKYAQELLFFTSKQRLAQRFRELVSKDFKEHHTVEYYADILCVTRGHLTKAMRETGNMTPKQCIAEIIVHHSQELLGSGEVSITSISELLGFSCPGIFSTFFKKHAGITPSQYRESLIK